MSVNPATYASVADVVNISQPHGIGYVWNTMLWEVYWNLVDRHGYNANVYDDWTSGGNNLALQLVMDGMKFQVCRPGFVDGRNAILQADVALTGGANQCEIWRGFAKRGLGSSATQGKLEQPERRPRGLRPSGELYRGDVRRLPPAGRKRPGGEPGQRGAAIFSLLPRCSAVGSAWPRERPDSIDVARAGPIIRGEA